MEQVLLINWLPIAAFFVGVVSRIFVPWLAKRRKNPEEAQWGWRYVWPQLLSVLLVILVLPLAVQDLDAIVSMQWAMAWLAGWGAADVGREIYKGLPDEEE